MKTITLIFVFLLAFTITSCSDDDDNITSGSTGTINGTLELPAEAVGKPWFVIVDTDINGDNGFLSSGNGICAAGTSISYSVEKVPTGKYFIYAVVFAVSDGSQGPQAGDYMGIYGGDFTGNVPGSPNATVTTGTQRFDISLSVWQ